MRRFSLPGRLSGGNKKLSIKLPSAIESSKPNLSKVKPPANLSIIRKGVLPIVRNIKPQFPVVSGGGSTPSLPRTPLPSTTDVVFAFSLVRVITGYSGNAITLIRDQGGASDDTQTYQFDDDGFLPVSTISSWAGAFDINVVTWYNQANDSVNFTQNTAANRLGFFIDLTLPTKCYIYNTGDSKYMENASFLFSSTTLWEVFTVCSIEDTGPSTASQIIWTSGDNSTTNRNSLSYSNGTQTLCISKRRTNNYGKGIPYNEITFDVPMCLYGANTANTPANGDIDMTLNSFDVSGTDNAAAGSTNTFRIGSSSANAHKGKLFEIIYTGSGTIHKTEFEDNIDTFYGLGFTPLTLDTSSKTGSALTTYTESTFTFASTIDPSLTDLSARYCYDDGFSNLPILVSMAGYVGDATDFDSAALQRMASYGVFVLAVNMRGRNGASGNEDSSGRELHDIIDAIAQARTTFGSLVHSQKVYIAGWSGGGGNTLNSKCKFPDKYSLGVSNFGMSDYGYDATNGWWYTNVAHRTNIENFIGDTPANIPNSYKARHTLLTNAIAKNSLTKLYLFHDDQDTSVNVVHSQGVNDAYTAEGNTNIVYNETTTTDSPRWLHGYPNGSAQIIQAETNWSGDLDLDPVSIHPFGNLPIVGYLITKYFEVWLGDNVTETLNGTNRCGTVKYLLTDDKYYFEVTPAADSGVNTKVIIKVGGTEYTGLSTANSVVSIEVDL